MPSLRYQAHDDVLCTFSTRTSATAAGSARSLQLSSSRPGQAVRSVREGGMDRLSQHKSHLAGLLSSSQPPRRASVLGHLSNSASLVTLPPTISFWNMHADCNLVVGEKNVYEFKGIVSQQEYFCFEAE
jgi:hypothetical protein